MPVHVNPLTFDIALVISGIRSQARLARRTCIDASRLNRLRKGYVEPRPEERRHLAAALGVPETALFCPECDGAANIRSEREGSADARP